MIQQYEFSLPSRGRGFHIITRDVIQQVDNWPDRGIFHLFIQHTSAGLSINENADPTVLMDYENFFNHIVPQNMPFVEHDLEGPDDMPAHIKNTLVGSSISIPIRHGRLALGTWQGIYLCEFRDLPHTRSFIATVYS
jgi:secondary thiamine-phosphate synthase enzyme